MARLYLNERLLREIGLDEPMIRTLRKLTEFVETQEALSAAEGAIDAAEADISTLTTATNANTAKNSEQDGRLDTIEADYVQKDQAAAPSFTAYAGQTVSAAYTQAEVQAIDDAAKANADAIAGLISALQAADVLT